MDSKYEAAAIAVKNAEQALESLKDFANAQYKAKGETMREQIANYIASVLADANYMLGGCLYNELSLSCDKDVFTFAIREGSIWQFDYPIFYININGDIKYKNELNEDHMLAIIAHWEQFKTELDRAIKRSLKNRTERINKEIARIADVNEWLAKWHV